MECDYFNGWIKKNGPIHKNIIKDRETQRYCWGTRRRRRYSHVFRVLSLSWASTNQQVMATTTFHQYLNWKISKTNVCRSFWFLISLWSWMKVVCHPNCIKMDSSAASIITPSLNDTLEWRQTLKFVCFFFIELTWVGFLPWILIGLDKMSRRLIRPRVSTVYQIPCKLIENFVR